MVCPEQKTTIFQSTRPVGGGTPLGCFLFLGGLRFQSTRPVGGGTPHAAVSRQLLVISIHPPRGGRDGSPPPGPSAPDRFQSTRPVGGGTPFAVISLVSEAFQSTRPVGGGTAPPRCWRRCPGYFNPPAPWGAGPPHCIVLFSRYNFNPPAPWGAGPLPAGHQSFFHSISIHPPRGGRDVTAGLSSYANTISIHPPRGGRDMPGAAHG